MMNTKTKISDFYIEVLVSKSAMPLGMVLLKLKNDDKKISSVYFDLGGFRIAVFSIFKLQGWLKGK